MNTTRLAGFVLGLLAVGCIAKSTNIGVDDETAEPEPQPDAEQTRAEAEVEEAAIEGATDTATACKDLPCPRGASLITSAQLSRLESEGFDWEEDDLDDYDASKLVYTNLVSGECEYTCVFRPCPEMSFPVSVGDCYSCAVLDEDDEGNPVFVGGCDGYVRSGGTTVDLADDDAAEVVTGDAG